MTTRGSAALLGMALGLALSAVAQAGVTRAQLLAYHEACVKARKPMRVAAELGKDLRGIDLSKVELVARRDVPAVALDGCDLTGADLRGARLVGVSLKQSVLDGVRGDGLVAIACNFLGARLVKARLPGARLDYSSFAAAVLIDVDLSRSSVIDGVFLSAGLERVDLTGATLRGARFNGAQLIGLRGISKAELEALDAANRVRDFRSRAYPKGSERQLPPRQIYLALLALLVVVGSAWMRTYSARTVYRMAFAANALGLVGEMLVVQMLTHQPMLGGVVVVWGLRLLIGGHLVALVLTVLYAMQHAVVRLVQEKRRERALLFAFLVPTIVHGAWVAVDLRMWAGLWGVW